MKKVEKPIITSELKKAVVAYLGYLAAEATLNPIVTGYLSQVLIDGNYMSEGRHGRPIEPITDREQAYKMSEADRETYFVAAHAAHVANGFGDILPEIGYCPLLIAQSQLADAKNAMLNAADYLAKGLTAKNYIRMEHREKAVKLISGLVLALCPEISTAAVIEQYKKQ